MNKRNNLFVEIHIIQNFAPANLNRDDSNMPKDAEFGGYRRARISSQCIKRSIRKSVAFAERVENVGYRTKTTRENLVEIFIDEHSLSQIEADTFTREILEKITGGYATKKSSKVLPAIAKDKTKVLYYTHESELKRIAKYVNDKKIEGEKNPVEAGYKEFIKFNANKIDTVDIALFGRMLADEPNMKIDAAAQVAHAISTNKLDSEFDFFTAVEDYNENQAGKADEDQGAGMMGDIGFNSSCYYRYALIDANKLTDNLFGKSDMAISGILGFIEGSIEAIPTGKQTSFAAQNPPEFIMLTIRENSAPMSLANAFARPVKVSGNGNDNLIANSVTELKEYKDKINAMYGAKGETTYISTIHKNEVDDKNKGKNQIFDNAEYLSIPELVEKVQAKLNEILNPTEA